ncbi:2756_t:CDS:2, partial [Gigaspora margarita]
MNLELFLENTNLDNNSETSSDTDISDDENSLDILNDSCELPNDSITSQGQITSNNPITIMVGKTFTDWNSVQEYINAYAISKGFATRLRRTERNMNIIIRADIVCRRAGVASNTSTGLRMTKSIATNCPFKVVVRWTKKNKYSVWSVNLEHNHLLDSAAIKFDPGHRRLSRNENAHIQMLYDSGVPVPTIVNMLTEQYNRYIHNKDVYNSLNHQSRDYVKGLSQTAELLNNLNNNDEYLVNYSINDEKLHCLFFATRAALSTFNCYPEILLMDSTYKTNRFGMPLLLVSGIDAMGISFLIASCLLANETTLNFCWALRQLKKIAGDMTVHRIKTLITDRDLALMSAVRAELPNVKHQLCVWHIEQNIIKNLNNKLKDKFMAFSKDFRAVMLETDIEQFNIRWNCLLIEYPEANTYITEQWKPYESMWAYSYTNKYVNYGVRTTQRSEATNSHLKRLLSHTAPLPELISALNKLTNHQLQCSQYQQYRLRNSIRQQCPKLLKDVSVIVSDFTYSLLLDQYNLAIAYEVERQEAGLLHVYRNEGHKHTIYQTDDEYICSCDYNVQFSLPCRHVLAVYIANKKVLSTDCIGARWIISSAMFNIAEEKENYVANNIVADNITINNIIADNITADTIINNNEFSNKPNCSTYDISTDQRISTRTTSSLLKDVENIVNRVGHVEINNTLALFQDIRDPDIAKTKGRPSGTKRENTGAKHVTKKIYTCGICKSAGHNSRSCPSK